MVDAGGGCIGSVAAAESCITTQHPDPSASNCHGYVYMACSPSGSYLGYSSGPAPAGGGTSATQPATQQPAPGGTYSSYQCGRFGLSCSNFDPKKAVPKSSGFNFFHWVAHTAAPAVWHAVKWGWAHRVPIANGIALGACLLEIGGPVGCVIAQGVAYAFRARERDERYGSAGSTRSNVADLLVTLLAVSSGGVLNMSLKKLGWSYLRRLPLQVYMSAGSVIGAFHKLLPGPVDPVFYNGTP